MHTYNLFGWYAGESFPDRQAPAPAPANLSTSETPGDLRANWTGYEWIELPYQPPPPYVEPLPSSLAEYDAALTDYLDSVARSRNWADRVSLMARAGFPGPWQADAIAFGTWADGCNVIGYQMLADFQNGLIQQPTIVEMIAALPPMVWPV